MIRVQQPNLSSEESGFSARFWVLVVVVGIGAGLAGAALMKLLRTVQHVVWSNAPGDFLDAVERSSAGQRLLVLLCAGAVSRP